MSVALKPISGILLLDKPINTTSNHILQKIKKLFHAQKAGHTGSLDPLATGMLPICFGSATKLSQYLLDSDKRYLVIGLLGVKTKTGDSEGEIISTADSSYVTLEKITSVLEKFRGQIYQTPPMFSAIKFKGQPLYKLARKGIEIPRTPRLVTIHNLELKEFANSSFSLDVSCSKGTYIRQLIEDIGDELQCGAHVTMLRRVSVKPFEKCTMHSYACLETVYKSEGSIGLLNFLLKPTEFSSLF